MPFHGRRYSVRADAAAALGDRARPGARGAGARSCRDLVAAVLMSEPSVSTDRPTLHRLAVRLGIAESYLDQSGGEQRVTTDATRERLLAAMGIDASTEERALHALRTLRRQARAAVDRAGARGASAQPHPAARAHPRADAARARGALDADAAHGGRHRHRVAGHGARRADAPDRPRAAGGATARLSRSHDRAARPGASGTARRSG